MPDESTTFDLFFNIPNMYITLWIL